MCIHADNNNSLRNMEMQTYKTHTRTFRFVCLCVTNPNANTQWLTIEPLISMSYMVQMLVIWWTCYHYHFEWKWFEMILFLSFASLSYTCTHNVWSFIRNIYIAINKIRFENPQVIMIYLSILVPIFIFPYKDFFYKDVCFECNSLDINK